MSFKRPRTGNSAQQPFRTGQPQINADEVELLHVLGKGSFGCVWKGSCRQKTVAVKILDRQDLDAKTLQSFRREVEIISNIPHPNIVQFMGACTVPGNLMIVTEFMPRGDLEDMLQKKNVPLSLYTRMRMAKDIALGMNWLHCSNPQFVHRDLKTKNLLIDENNRIKICDFGLSQVKAYGAQLQDAAGAKGTPLWMAPEVLLAQRFDEKADIYSYGLVLWAILTRQEPFAEFTELEPFRNAICHQHYRPPLPEDCPDTLRQLITACWDPSARLRPSFTEIIRQLDEITVDAAISDPLGSLFWKQKFLGREFLPWTDFYSAFQTFLQEECGEDRSFDPLPATVTLEQLARASDFQLNEFGSRSLANSQLMAEELTRRYGTPSAQLDDYADEKINARCLQSIFSETPAEAGFITEGVEQDEESVVRLEHFGTMLGWFGPIVDSESQQLVLVNRVRRLLANPWFHGGINQTSAEDLLRQQEPGTFLIRFSSIPGCYTISKMCEDRIIHQRFSFTPGYGYIFNGVAYPTIEALLVGATDELGLRFACPGSRFQKIFDVETPSGYIQNQPGGGASADLEMGE